MNLHLHKLSLMAYAGLLSLCAQYNPIHAQTVSSFEDIVIADDAESYGLSLPPVSTSTPYTFTSGNINLGGIQEFWGGVTGFDCSKSSNNTDYDYLNDRSSITGSGSDSSNQYGIAYLNSDWPDNPTSTVPIGFTLIGDAASSHLLSMDITNTTYTYFWIQDNLESISYLKLTIQGYNSGSITGDPIEYNLAEITDSDTFILNTWKTINLTSLGAVDSITFKLDSDNDYTPFYFAFDNIVTFDNSCNAIYNNAIASDISTNSFNVTHTSEYEFGIKNIEYVLDESSTIVPTGTINISSVLNFSLTDLEPNTSYVYHYRTQCINDNWTDWDTLHVNTLSTSIEESYKDLINIYPNPVSNHLFIQGAPNNCTYKIVSLLGHQVKNGHISDEINLTHLPTGIYLLQIINDDQIIYNTKLIKNEN